jgi:hypothetical protein
MQTDVRLREAARAIYDACFTLAPITFEEAERRGTLHHRRAMKAAHDALSAPTEPVLP